MVAINDLSFIQANDSPRLFLKNLYGTRQKMIDSGFSLVYEGIIDHNIIKAFASLTEKKMDTLNEELVIKKKVFNVMVECLQNISMHTEDSYNDDPLRNLYGNGIFIVGKVGPTYNIITGNYVETGNVPSLKSTLDSLKELNINELKILHREKLKESEITFKGGAGLGLIEIAKKANGKIDYHFIDDENNQSFFILKVEI